MARNGRTTIAEVAALAGVSRTTVSHVLSGNRPVAATTRERVERTIDELGFRPNGLARSLRTQRSDTIALVIPDITNPFYPVLARGLDDAMSGRYRTYICNTDAVRVHELEFIADVADRHVDGMVIVPFQLDAADLNHVLDLGMPVVCLGGRVDDPRVDVVLTDDEHGAFEATRHLISRGHGRVGMIRGARGTDLQRYNGYRRALAASGIPVESALTAEGAWTRSGGAHAMATLLALPEPPTAVFSANDLMAIGAMDAAREAMLSIPGDLALVGYDDIEAAALVNPPLTTIINPAYDAGRVAGRLLAERISGGYSGERREVVLHSRLVDRGST